MAGYAPRVTDDDAQDEPSAPERVGFLSRFAPKPSGPLADDELRGRMRTLDPVERKWGFAVGAVPLVVALVNLAVHAKVSVLKPLVLGRCLAPGHLVGKSCTELVTQKASVPEVALLAFLGIVIMLSVWRSMRTLVAVATIFAGLASGLLGIVSIFYGGWLLLRSWRLQRYGVKDGRMYEAESRDEALAVIQRLADQHRVLGCVLFGLRVAMLRHQALLPLEVRLRVPDDVVD